MVVVCGFISPGIKMCTTHTTMLQKKCYQLFTCIRYNFLYAPSFCTMHFLWKEVACMIQEVKNHLRTIPCHKRAKKRITNLVWCVPLFTEKQEHCFWWTISSCSTHAWDGYRLLKLLYILYKENSGHSKICFGEVLAWFFMEKDALIQLHFLSVFYRWVRRL